MTKQRWITVLVVGSIPIVVCGGFIAHWSYFHKETYPWMYTAEYRSFELEGRTRGTHLRFMSGRHRFHTFANGEIADIFIKFPNGKAYHLRQLPEDAVVEYIEAKHPYPPGETEGLTEYRDNYTFFFFRGGRLECVHLEKTDVLVGNSLEGPFYGLPMSRRVARRTFGPPAATRSEISY